MSYRRPRSEADYRNMERILKADFRQMEACVVLQLLPSGAADATHAEYDCMPFVSRLRALGPDRRETPNPGTPLSLF